MNTRWHDLTFDRLKDGGIHLEQQSGCEEPNVIHLHPVQLRHIAETFGLVAPNHPADELSKQLAEQLCRVFLDMCDDYRHLSHALEDVYLRLDGYISALPDAIFPHHLWEEREKRERKAKEQKQAANASNQPIPTVDISSNSKTQQSLIVSSQVSNPNLFDLMLPEGQP